MSPKFKIAVIGASGYSGAEIVALLLNHPAVELNTLMTANIERQNVKSRKYSEELHQFYRRCDLEIEPLDLDQLVTRKVSIVFLATPNETSHELVPQILQKGFRVIDLSGAFRLKNNSLYPQWYGFEHQHSTLLKTAVYGLTEIYRDQIRQARLLANPGCYPTSALLPLIPLQRAGMIDPEVDIICDSKSGVSGTGKTPSAATHFSEVTESFKAYSVFKHRHAPEIWQELQNSHLIFTPHLLPINRGILSTIYLKLRKSETASKIEECFYQAYAHETFIRLFSNDTLPEVKFVAHTNFCDIGWKFESDRSNLILLSAIDNIGKGAAGQAVQNMNVMLGIDEKTGLM